MGLAEGACPWPTAVHPMGEGEEAALHSPKGEMGRERGRERGEEELEGREGGRGERRRGGRGR